MSSEIVARGDRWWCGGSVAVALGFPEVTLSIFRLGLIFPFVRVLLACATLKRCVSHGRDKKHANKFMILFGGLMLFGGWDARALARTTCYFSKHVRCLLVLAGVITGGSRYLAGAENGGNRSVPAIRT